MHPVPGDSPQSQAWESWGRGLCTGLRTSSQLSELSSAKKSWFRFSLPAPPAPLARPQPPDSRGGRPCVATVRKRIRKRSAGRPRGPISPARTARPGACQLLRESGEPGVTQEVTLEPLPRLGETSEKNFLASGILFRAIGEKKWVS